MWGVWLLHGLHPITCLLVAPLHGAIPFVQVDYVSMVVSQDLHLDVSRVFDVLFNKHAAIPK